MTDIRKLILCAAVALALGACSKEGAEEETASQPAPAPAQPAQRPGVPDLPVEPPPEATLPTEVKADAVTVGGSLQGNTVVKSPTAQFTMADTVYAGASTKGKKPGGEVAVYWTYQDGRTHKEERRKLADGEQYVSFSFGKADGMMPGKYNAQIDVDMVPIGLTDFVVK
jgi:glucose/arabinose dehydrogenase